LEARREAERLLEEAKETIQYTVLEAEARLRERERASERYCGQLIEDARRTALEIIGRAHSEARIMAEGR
jgi:F0F1-type ATP synthase membrane subunit b/b'